ncbi:unnamed protein product, partial [Effrenium voratum]
MGTTQKQLLGRYLRFCEFLWREMVGGKKKTVAVTATGKEVPVDGHYMCLAGTGTAYVALTALAATKEETVEQSIAQPAAASGNEAWATPRSQSIAQTHSDEVAEESTEVTEEVLATCQAIAATCSHYSDLVEAEVAALVGLGLRPSRSKDGYLTCVHCRNSRRKEKQFQGTDQVREHFQQNHERPEEPTRAPSAAVTAAVPAADWEPEKLVG